MDDEHCLRLVFQFGSDMSTGVVVVLVEVEHTVDVQVVLARPRHQHGHDIGGFLGVVDVVHQVTETVNDDKSVALAFAQRVVDETDAQRGSVLTQYMRPIECRETRY